MMSGQFAITVATTIAIAKHIWQQSRYRGCAIIVVMCGIFRGSVPHPDKEVKDLKGG